jgi:outer membrane receptor protein involved in Fe transport
MVHFGRILYVAVPAIALAQSVPAPTPSPEVVSDEAVLLSPFEVTTDRDEGYFSPDTLSGGRTNTALKDTPAAISIMNQQFIQDIAATDIYQAEIWNVNAQPTYDPGNATTGSNNRGPNFSFFSRNYFLWYVKSDSFNTERFEFARGPNGVLFGDGNIGGLATTMTKQAYIGKEGLRMSLRFDSYGGYRSSADVHIPVGKRLALRVNLLNDRSTMWQDNSRQYRDGVHLAGTVKITDKTQFRFEGELGDINRQIYVPNYLENASYWNGSARYDGVTAPNTTGTGVARMSTSTYFVNIPGTPEAGYANWSTFYRTTGANLAMQDRVTNNLTDLPRLPRRKLNVMPSDARYLLKYATSTYYLEHRFSDDLFAQLAFNSTRSPYEPNISETAPSAYYLDVNTVLPNGLVNPNYGKPYSDVTLNKTFQMNTVSELRALIAYRFSTKWWKANINAIGGTRFDKFDFDQRRLVRTNGTNPNLAAAENEYHYRVYWDDLTNFGETPNIPGMTFDYRYTNIIHQRKFIDYTQLATVNKFFDDRVTLFLGGRFDQIYQSQQNQVALSATGSPILGATIIPAGSKVAAAVPGAKSKVEKDSTNFNYGAVYNPLSWLGVYYNFSETFGTPDSGNNLIDGTPPGVSHSKSHEYGLKFTPWRGKVYAEVRYYDSIQENLLTTTGAATQINAIWTALGRTDLTGLAYRDTQSLELKGYEFELVGNPTKNIRLMANYSLPRQHKNVDALPGLRGYYAQHLAQWQAAAVTDTTVQTNLTTIETLLRNNASFATTSGFTKYRANFYGTYSFLEGSLKGLSVGGGTNIVGPAKVGSGSTAYDYLYADSYYLLTLNASYSMKIRKARVQFQINVNNLLDEDDTVTTAFASYRQDGQATNPLMYVPSRFRYHNPRQLILSASVSF